MRSVLLFLLILCLSSKNASVSSVTVQSVFFISALIKNGIFTDKKNISVKSIVCGAFILLSGFALSAVLTLYSVWDERAEYLSLSLAAFGIYFIFFSFIIAMSEYSKTKKATKSTALICTLFPSITAVFAEGISVLFSVILILSGCIALYLIAAKRKKAVRKQP